MSSSLRSSRGRRWLPLALGVVVLAGLGSALGFEVGRRWPLERVEEWLGLREPPGIEPWELFATTDFPRYAAQSVQVNSRVFVFGGFWNRRLEASRRVDVLDLEAGAWSRLGEMPEPVTHAGTGVVDGRIWLVGGFVGDDPGAATDRVHVYDIASGSWSEGPPLPAPRGGGAVVVRADTLHYLSGYLPDRATNAPEHWMLAPGDTSWVTGAPVPEPRGHMAAVEIGGRILLAGGAAGHDPFAVDLERVDIFDPEGRSWVPGPSLPFELSHSGPTTQRYAGGVLTSGGRSLGDARYSSDDLLFLDLDRGRWFHEGRVPAVMRGGVMGLRGDSVVAGLGAEPGPNPGNPRVWIRGLRDTWRSADPLPVPLGGVSGGIIDGTLYLVGEGSRHTLAYDIAAGRWHPVGSLSARPVEGGYHGAAVVDGRLVLVGGLARRPLHGVVQIYDPAADRWTLGPPLPFPAGASASAVVDGALYVAGGLVDDSASSRAAVLDLADGSWRALPDLPRARSHAAAGTDGERFWVFGGRAPGAGARGGAPGSGDEVQVFDPGTGRWEVSDGSPGSPPALPRPRSGTGRAVLVAGELWLLGGEGPDGRPSRVDILDPREGSWRRGPELLTPRGGTFPVAEAGRIYLAGGGTEVDLPRSHALEIIWTSGPPPGR